MKTSKIKHSSPYAGWLLLAIALLVLAPAVLSDFRLGLLAKYCCYAIAAVGIGLAWGRGGMLVLGQGLYFGLGAYAMAMHLKLADAGPGGVPDFMALYGDAAVPWWWEPLRSGAVAVVVILVLPVIVAGLLGLAVFKRRIKGAYFAILSQALAAAFAILLIGQVKTTGGANGLNNFQGFFGYALFDPANKRMLYFVAAGILLVSILAMAWLHRSRFGELLVAVRDGEERVRFLGTDPANVKLAAYVVAAVLASVGGALFVPIAGIVSPDDVGVVASIGLLAGVALGGRASLLGPAVGALLVGYAETSLSEAFPGSWSYFQGALFVLVILLLPGGLAQLVGMAKRTVAHRERPALEEAAAR
ncbi:urea transport system permease protein [Nocardioides luteus]|uniref:Urea ABC transporter permease subunit UrtC n=1 Tax=Nocardioides luteus TaxID=1844 RepID=A0ABQ5SRY6_9ACTN|nr:urea ABC transporter permease subunit UrtC [Nocardioides luteus]MDR7311238.1 urea transport system permease protein [Nocardioides luteus]GGR63254.1 urea ABC transporter permease subunit UrtC [Nocardioides luteus]GLJ66785.1 urea ABC transporter permease subunit UrtC [Nocardioides luteus]